MKISNKQIIKFIGIFAFVMSISLPVFADETDRKEIRADIKTERANLRANITDKKEAFRADAKEDRGVLQSNIKTRVNEVRVDVKAMKDAGATPEQIKTKLDEARAANQAEREKFREELELKRKVMKDDIAKEINSFKEGKKVKLADAARAQVKQRLSAAFTKMSSAIGKITDFDRKLSEEISRRKSKSLDVANAEVALEDARRSLEETKITVTSVNAAVSSSVDATLSGSKEAIKSVIENALQSIKGTKSKYDLVVKQLPVIPEDSIK